MAYFHPFEFAIDVLLSGCIDWGVGFMEPYPDPDNFPLEQPYNAPPWNYEGTESVAFLPNNNIVDWVLVELRVPPGDASTATEATRVARQAAFLLDEGHVVGLDGESNLTFEVDSSSNFHVVIWHRNHLGILSAEPLYGAPGGYMYLYQYDFISTADQAYGGPLAQKEVAPGIWGMIGADGDANGIIGIPDKEIWSLQAGEDGYQAGDYNLDGQIENKDKNDVWVQNIGENSQLPPEGDCGNQITDIDGNTYNTVQIGDQCWMKENLKTTTYQNGTSIPNVTNGSSWYNLTTGAYVWYDNDISWKGPYGALYNWYATIDTNGLCPTGWHVPTNDEWTALTNHIGGTAEPHANYLKSCRQVNSPIGGNCNTSEHPRWDDDIYSGNGNYGTDDYGFSCLPGGGRYGIGTFYYIGTNGTWWSSTETSGHAWTHSLSFATGSVAVNNGTKERGLSVRCVKD